jgi:putative transposase
MSTFYSLNYHITFSTKNRVRMIGSEWMDRLHAYIGGIAKQLDGKSLKVGGIEDHVHILVGLKTTHNLADFMRELKKSSSKWVHEEIKVPSFQWQEGYAAFSVSPTACKSVAKYIANQKKHHRVKTFREELESLLRKAEIEFDPQYLD